MCVFFPSLLSTPDLSCRLPLALLLLFSSAQNNVSKVSSPKGGGQACIFFRKCSAGSTGWPVLSKQIASEQRGVRELGLPEKNKVLSPINHSLCSGRCLPNEVEIIGGCCGCPYFTDTEHCLFKGLKWSDSTHLSDFFISKPEHQ